MSLHPRFRLIVLSGLWMLSCLTVAHAETFVSGVVRDHLTGMPISGADVALVRNGIQRDHATSAADGSYVIEPYLPFPGSTFEVYTTADGYVESHKVFDATSPNAHVDVALIETATIAGTVRMPGGGTRANIPVSVAFQLGDGTWYQTFGSTQADGSFSVNALAPRSYRVCSGGIESGALQQCFDHLDHVSASGEPAFSAVTVGEGEERTGIDFDLDNGGSISGQLVDAHTSSPLAGYAADLQLYDAAGEFLGDQAFTTDAGGHYQVRGLPNGTFHVVLASSGPFIDDSQVYPAIACDPNCDPLLGDLVTIAASGDVAHIDFSFHPDALVHGKVVDAADGVGLDGVVVSAYVAVPTPMGTSYALVWSTTSHGAEGAYELYLRGYDVAEPYYIAAEPAAPFFSTVYPGVSCTILRSCIGNGVPLSVHPAATLEGINMTLPTGSAISGRVTDAASGVPLLAAIDVFDVTDQAVWWGFTNADGSYSSNAFPAGTYHAVATVAGWPFACAVYLDRPCPAAGAPLSSVNPTPLILQTGEVRTGTDFRIDTDKIFGATFDP